MQMDIKEAAKAVNGRVERDGNVFSSVSTDSRAIESGALFVALKGPNFDGHAFLSQVAEKGAIGAIVNAGAADQAKLPQGFALISVEDTLRALGDLASYVRQKLRTPVVAISGSAGKTTTKEMVASILNRSKKVLKTVGNLNNLIGVPLTLLKLEPSHEVAVVELGISMEGEMERLVEISQPDVALITNIGRGHLEFLGTREGVARAKGPLFTMLSPNATKVVNLDDEFVVRLAGKNGARTTYSAVRKDADVFVESSLSNGFTIEATYAVRGARVEVAYRTPGAANVINGAAAIAASLPFNPSIKDMEEGLSSFSSAKRRMEVINVNGVVVLDDTYNANPDSMAMAIKTLARAPGRKVAVLGDMLELGGASTEAHREVGSLCASLGIDVLVAIGQFSEDMAGGAKDAKIGVCAGFADKARALEYLHGLLRDGDCVLVKGSRAIGLEYIVEGIKGFRVAC